MSGSLFVGIDGHKNFSFLCAMTEEGEIIEEKKVKNEEIEKIIETFANPSGDRTNNHYLSPCKNTS